MIRCGMMLVTGLALAIFELADDWGGNLASCVYDAFLEQGGGGEVYDGDARDAGNYGVDGSGDR